MKVIVVDDEKAMLLVMKRMLAKISEIEIAGLFQQGSEALDYFRDKGADLAFIDINLQEESGFELAKRMLDVSNTLHVVFSTSHREYAVDAFEISAFDYLVKPVSQARLERTIKKALERKFLFIKKEEDLKQKKLAAYCFGRMDVSSEQCGMVKWRSTKSEELLAYLFLNRERSVSRARIVEDLFPNTPLKNAETYLNTAIYQLRKSLEPFGLKSMVISGHGNLRLDTKEVYLDFVDFENRIKAMTSLHETNFQDAVATEKLYIDDLFGDKTYVWAVQERERLAMVYAAFAQKLSEYLLNNHHFELSFQVLKRLIQRNPFDEKANALLLKLDAKQRDMTSLVQHYDRYVRMLHWELDVKPGKELTNLFNELKRELS